MFAKTVQKIAFYLNKKNLSAHFYFRKIYIQYARRLVLLKKSNNKKVVAKQKTKAIKSEVLKKEPKKINKITKTIINSFI